MSTSNQIVKVVLLGNGGTTVFSTDMELSDEDVLVNASVVDLELFEADGTQTNLTVDVDFSYTIVSGKVQITYPLSGAALPTGASLVAYRRTPAIQEFESSFLRGFSPALLGIIFDKQMRVIQEQQGELDRTIKTIGTYSGDPVELGAPDEGKSLIWQDSRLVAGPTGNEIEAAQGYAEDALTAKEAAEQAAEDAALSISSLPPFTNVADMVANTSLSVGDYIQTLGYHDPGDGGANKYEVVEAGTESADGGSFINLTGSGLQAKALFSDGEICPMQFGARGDGVTDDKAVFNAMLAYGEVIGADPYWDENGWSDFPRKITYSGRNRNYAVSGPVTLNYGNRNSTLRDFSMTAIAGTWETAGGTATTEREFYEPQKSDHIFTCFSRATFIYITNCVFNCNNLCGGVSLSARSTISYSFIKKCAGVGVRTTGGDVYVSHCRIYQWLATEAEYFDKDAYTGVGVLTEVSDARVDHCVIAHMHECLRFNNTNCHVWGGHFFNGCNPFKAADRSDNDDLDEDLRVYFGFSTLEEVRAYDFPVRTYNAGVVTANGAGLDMSFNNLYLDNCHNEHYSDRVLWNSPMLGNIDSSTHLGMVLYWWNFHCHTNGADPRCRINDIQVQVQSGAKERYFKFSAHNGNSWNENYTWLEDDAHANQAENIARYADGLTLNHPYTHYGVNGRDGDPHVMYAAPAAGSFLGFYDSTTSLDGDLPDLVRIGATGNSFQSRAFQHTFRSRDGVDEHLTITANGTLRFTSLSAEPTSQNGDLARSEGTASTNGFGVDGPGLYFKTGGTWTKL